MSRGPILALVVCTLCPGPFAEAAPVPLDVAVQSGLVEVVVRGRGACSGDAIQVELRRKVDGELHVIVEPGTVMESTSGQVQSMICHGVRYQKTGKQYRRVDAIVLNDDQPQTYLLEGFCRDFRKPTPRNDSTFRIGLPDRQVTSVIVRGKAVGASLRTIQVAVWLQRGVRSEDVRQRFGASEAEVNAASSLVAAASAAERGDTAAAETAEQSVRVLVGNLVDAARERRERLGFRRGDMVTVTVEHAPIGRLIGSHSRAKKGDTFQVLAVVQDRVHVESAGDGKPAVRGWIAVEHVQLADGAARGEGRPLIRRIGEVVSETELEIITATERGF